jgi:signal recognition particle subunit SEC65
VDQKEAEEIKKWRAETGLTFIVSPSEDAVEKAIKSSGEGFSELHPRSQDEVLSILSSWHFYLSAEMGRIYARVVINANEVDRAKLNMVKPVAEALKVKIETLKKIYDRRIRELQNPKRAEEV